MRVALEATGSLAHRFTGLQRYILELACAFAELNSVDLRCEMLLRLANFRKRDLKPAYPWPVRWYCSGPWPAVPRCDVLHGLGVRLPRTPHRVARVSTFHDMSPLSLPRYGSVRTLRNTLKHYRHAARHADRIITVSEATRTDFLQYFDYPEQHIVAVHLGVGAAFLSEASVAVASAAVEPPYFVAFGGNPRKNLRGLIQAFSLCSLRDDAELRIVGGLRDDERDALRQLELEERVRLVDNLDDEGMARLYGGSMGLLFPSLLEGFGLPILEAMACRIPVLTSARAGTAEIAGGHAVLVDPDSPEAVAAGIDGLPGIAPQALAAAASYARTFTWRRTAEQTLAVYRSAVA